MRRVANSADLNGLSLEGDLTGAELIQEGADGEERDELQCLSLPLFKVQAMRLCQDLAE